MNTHTHIATDSACAQWQIGNIILFPQLMKRHEHAKLLETIVHHIQLSKDSIHRYKVKAHAGILGNKLADAIAKCSAENQRGRDIHIYNGAHSHSSIFWPARVKTLTQLAYQILLTPANQSLQQTGSLFSQISIRESTHARPTQTKFQIKKCFKLSSCV
jgi:hypothetical protein